MAVVLTLLSYVGIASAFVALTLAIASGLYILSEQVEEHTVTTKRLLTRLIHAIIAIHILLLLFDHFPLWTTLFSIASNFVYLRNLTRFPFITLTSGTFLLSCVCVVSNHYLWFRYFTDPAIPPYAIFKTNPHFGGQTHPPFAQVASFLGICVWMIPFALFISLSANDNVLPMTDPALDDTGAASAKARAKSTGLAKVIIGTAYDWIKRVSRALGYELDPNYGRIV
ncbi:uncharacterized protein SAPINGB_P003944 [Magnusiomyces paraingens]|uniref:Uncharacterized protein n=1 Tax=Magnusiomyces paraingens TaxID=2606893 RepID=A0A5E8BZD9_9ASCO|nr:uncharacterized protein SAPINGB_P003944 [Saprochaete ingens]VVT54175.1 unnamed protein product [Saprochaete ingens]